MKSTLTAIGLLGSFIVFLLAADGSSAEVNPKTAMQQAGKAVRDGRLPEALAGYERVAADPGKDAVKYKADAMYQLLLLRVSADPAVRDLPRGAALAADLQRAYPGHERAREIAAIAAFAQLLQDADHGAAEAKRLADGRLADVSRQLKAAAGRNEALTAQLATQAGTAKTPDESAKLRQEIATLRTEARNLRDQLAKTQAELQKKDEALKKIAGSMMRPR